MNFIREFLAFIPVFCYVIIIGCGDDELTHTNSRLIVVFEPRNDTVITTPPVLFKWSTTSENADSFKLQITQDSDFVSNITSYSTSSTEYSLTPAGDTNYFYWRVKAYWGSHSDSDVSFTRKFKIR